ncbi:tetratricopeptide repeat protein [Parabacteroides sp. PF5-6]|uniref:type IX secretion system periplasmic lipoprotein PorW/SprE n=1 Tax=Parabacteroides sp. PF5-6 TaxID=1742403 RepID=UPI002405C4E7|nr:tetratricopeptide repeat protein [Parabacteroides sp. PF5-6]MDF9829192.1 tetratricopeptide (TPR) repeat protein [Parabacteroides sp. PF5-6]
MKKGFYFILSSFTFLLLWSCSTQKNTKASRFYHSFTTRYNIYYNGKVSFDESLDAMQKNYKESYTDRILMYPISAQPKDKATPGGPFDRAIEKSNKAIKLHSIKVKPEKKPGWRNDPKQVAIQEKEEYNPFLKNSWLMLGQGQFYNADFLQAAATFSYIARHYATDLEVATEARLWQARSYAEMGWLFESEDILKKLNINGIPKKNLKQYAAVNADYLIKEQRFEEAIPYLQQAIKNEKNKLQRTRMRYLLGQIYIDQGLNGMAYDMFSKVARANPPYELEFAARIRQTEVFTGSNYMKMVKQLERMARSDKNKDYLDQVYYAIGNIYINQEDTLHAIENYELAVAKSTQNGMDKAIAQIRVGDIYFTQGDYIKAQPHFSGALAGIQKQYKDYERVAKLSSVLDELVIHAEAVHLQDSLQTLARMPEEERLAVIDKIIEQVIKEEKEAKENADREAYLAEQEAQGSGLEQQETGGIQLPTAGSDGSFYFYSPQLVAQGKTQFQRRWGRRALEDDWRRAKKAMSTFEEPTEAEGVAETETPPAVDAEGNPVAGDAAGGELGPDLADDPKSREYYIQQLPLTPEDIEASNVIIVDGLFHMGMIYKDKLEDLSLAIKGLEELNNRFPENEHRQETYYQIFLMALRLGNTALANEYKDKLIQAYPDSDYAVAVADPDYEYNVRMMDVVQDSIYQTTYDRYLAGDVNTVRRNYKEVSEKYPLAKLMPKFMFLDALTYVETADVEGFKEALKTLLDKYPKADVSELAGEMLKGVLRGRALVQGSVRGMTWNLRFGGEGELSAADSARVFTAEKNLPYRMMLVFPTGSLDRNQLLFAVAAYNFANFLVKEVDLSFEEAGPVTMLMITGFYHFDEIMQYYKMIYEPEGYATALNRDVSAFPISEDNYETLMRGKTLDEYVAFFEETYGEAYPDVIARWHIRKDADEEEAEEEAEAEAGAKEEMVTPPVAEDRKEAEEVVIPPVAEERKEAEEEVIEKPEEVLTPVDSTTVLPADTIRQEIVPVPTDTVPVYQPPVEDQGLTLKEIEEIRKREAEEKAAREEEIRLAKEAEEKAEQELKIQQAREREELLKKQKAEDEALLKAKAEQEKKQELDRKAKLKQAEADRKAKEKAQRELQAKKEKEYKARLKQREKERKEREREYQRKLKEKEKAQTEARRAREAEARAKAKSRKR